MNKEIKRLFDNLNKFLECELLGEELNVWKSELKNGNMKDINNLKKLNNMMEDELSYIKDIAIEDMPNY